MPNIERVDDVIEIQAQYAEKEMIKRVPGSRWNIEKKIWFVPLTWTACVQLRGIFGASLSVGPELTRWSRAEFDRRVTPALALRTLLSLPDDDENDVAAIVRSWRDQRDVNALQLFDYQEADVAFLVTAGNAFLGSEMGLGKSAAILHGLRARDELYGDAFPALIVCPNSVKYSWVKQIELWWPTVTPFVVQGSAANRRKIIENARTADHALVIINYEALRLMSRLAPYGSIRLARCRECDPRHGDETLTPARCEVHRKELNGFGFKTVIIDEAHRVKSSQSKQTRAAWAIGRDPSVTTRWALTGTAISNHVGDLWSIMHFIDSQEYPNRSKFIDRYALQACNAFGGMDIIGVNPATRDEFFKIIDARYRRTPKALVLSQLPPKIRSTRWVGMTPKQRKAYDELHRRLTTIMDDGTPLTVYDHLVKNTRMLQLTSSYADVEWIEHLEVTNSDNCMCAQFGKVTHSATCPKRWECKVTLTEPSPKLDALEDILDELGDKPVVVAAQSAQLIALAAKRLDKAKIPYGRIVGEVSTYERQVALDRFQRGELRIMLITIDAGGEGVDGLQYADTMVILQRSWKMVANVQLEARVDRIGSEKHDSVHIIDVVTRDSIEETRLFPRLQEKFEQLEEIQRDRVRLSVQGIDAPEMFTLDARETAIIQSDLGANA